MSAIFLYIKRNYLIFFYITGVFLGIFYFLNLSEGYIQNLESYSIYFSERFKGLKIMDARLVADVFGKRIRELILLYLIGYTSVHKPFNCMYCSFVGFCNCIYLYVATVNYKTSGMGVYLAMVFPQYLIWIPILIYVLKYGGRAKSVKQIFSVAGVILIVSLMEAIIEVMVGYKLFSTVLSRL